MMFVSALPSKMSCCSGNCGCGASCGCGSSCHGCKMYPLPEGSNQPVELKDVSPAENEPEFTERKETETMTEGGETPQGCNCNPCNCNPCKC